MPRRKGATRAAELQHHPRSARPQDTGHSSPAKAMDAAGRGGLVAATQEAGKRLGIDALPPKVPGEGAQHPKVDGTGAAPWHTPWAAMP